MKEFVIANQGAGYIGKSSSVRAVYQLLKDKGHKLFVEEWQGEDIKAIFEVDGLKVGVESQGDPSSQMGETMEKYVEVGCDIIVTACRTKSDTYHKVTDYLGEENGYDVLWAAHYVYQAPFIDESRALLNDCYAQQVYQLIQDRIKGVI